MGMVDDVENLGSENAHMLPASILVSSLLQLPVRRRLEFVGTVAFGVPSNSQSPPPLMRSTAEGSASKSLCT